MGLPPLIYRRQSLLLSYVGPFSNRGAGRMEYGALLLTIRKENQIEMECILSDGTRIQEISHQQFKQDVYDLITERLYNLKRKNVSTATSASKMN